MTRKKRKPYNGGWADELGDSPHPTSAPLTWVEKVAASGLLLFTVVAAIAQVVVTEQRDHPQVVQQLQPRAPQVVECHLPTGEVRTALLTLP